MKRKVFNYLMRGLLSGLPFVVFIVLVSQIELFQTQHFTVGPPTNSSPTVNERSSEPGRYNPMARAVQEGYKNLVPGQIAFDPPRKMKAYESKIVVARISDDLRRNLTAGLENNPITAKIKVSTFMKAVLQGSDFIIEPQSSEKQALPEGSVAEWRWKVTPTESGDQKLFLTVYARIKLSEQSEEEVYLETYEKQVNVDVNPFAVFKEIWKWIVENFENILKLSAMLAAVVAYLLARYKSLRNWLKNLRNHKQA